MKHSSGTCITNYTQLHSRLCVAHIYDLVNLKNVKLCNFVHFTYVTFPFHQFRPESTVFNQIYIFYAQNMTFTF